MQKEIQNVFCFNKKVVILCFQITKTKKMKYRNKQNGSIVEAEQFMGQSEIMGMPIEDKNGEVRVLFLGGSIQLHESCLWVLNTKSGIFVFSNEAFSENFEPVKDETDLPKEENVNGIVSQFICAITNALNPYAIKSVLLNGLKPILAELNQQSKQWHSGKPTMRPYNEDDLAKFKDWMESQRETLRPKEENETTNYVLPKESYEFWGKEEHAKQYALKSSIVKSIIWNGHNWTEVVKMLEGYEVKQFNAVDEKILVIRKDKESFGWLSIGDRISLSKDGLIWGEDCDILNHYTEI